MDTLSIGQHLTARIAMDLDYDLFRTFCGAHVDFVTQEKWEEFNAGWPAVRYVLPQLIDHLIGVSGDSLNLKDEDPLAFTKPFLDAISTTLAIGAGKSKIALNSKEGLPNAFVYVCIEKALSRRLLPIIEMIEETYDAEGEAAVHPTGVELIAAERRRQVEEEGWTAEHDDEHTRGELIDAGLSYIRSAINAGHPAMRTPPSEWPWDPSWWKPSSDTTRNLVKAGALFAAEMDRLQRAAATAEVEE